MIPFGAWLPDLADFDNPGTPWINNVFPAATSYRPVGSSQSISDALSETPLGGVSAQTGDGAVVNFAGTGTGLYRLSETTWQDITRSAGAYATGSDETWSFAQFGDLVIGTNYSDVPQKYDLDLTSPFADLGGTPPQARHIAVVRDFVVLGNLSTQRNGIHWSAFGDPEGWTIGTDQSDFQNFPDGGWVQGILGGESGYIFLERAIISMIATGDEFVFQFDVVEKGRGLRAPGSLIQVGRTAFYLANDGFYQFEGGRSVPIGAHKVDKTFFADADETHLSRMTGVADPINKIVVWSYASNQSIDGEPDRLIMFNWATGGWSQADMDARLIVPVMATGYTLEGLDAISTDLDLLGISLDSRLWTDGALALGVFGLDDKLALLTGPALEATLETREAELQPGQRAFVREIRPIVDTSAALISLGRREVLSATPSYTAEAALTASGRCPVRSSGRFQRARLRIPAGSTWTHAQGVDFIAVEDGSR